VMVVPRYVLHAIHQLDRRRGRLPALDLIQAFLVGPAWSRRHSRRLDNPESKNRNREQRDQEDEARVNVLHPTERLTSIRPMSAIPNRMRLETLWKKPSAAS